MSGVDPYNTRNAGEGSSPLEKNSNPKSNKKNPILEKPFNKKTQDVAQEKLKPLKNDSLHKDKKVAKKSVQEIQPPGDKEVKAATETAGKVLLPKEQNDFKNAPTISKRVELGLPILENMGSEQADEPLDLPAEEDLERLSKIDPLEANYLSSLKPINFDPVDSFLNTQEKMKERDLSFNSANKVLDTVLLQKNALNNIDGLDNFDLENLSELNIFETNQIDLPADPVAVDKPTDSGLMINKSYFEEKKGIKGLTSSDFFDVTFSSGKTLKISPESIHFVTIQNDQYEITQPLLEEIASSDLEKTDFFVQDIEGRILFPTKIAQVIGKLYPEKEKIELNEIDFQILRNATIKFAQAKISELKKEIKKSSKAKSRKLRTQEKENFKKQNLPAQLNPLKEERSGIIKGIRNNNSESKDIRKAEQEKYFEDRRTIEHEEDKKKEASYKREKEYKREIRKEEEPRIS